MRDNDTEMIVFVTGPAGAGRGTALNALEDAGFEVIDNLPLALVLQVAEGRAPGRPLALGIDPRSRDFAPDNFLQVLEDLRARDRNRVDLVFLDCAVQTLLRRFSETRRRHPLSAGAAPSDGIALEILLLEPMRLRADYLIDTSEMSPHDLRAEMTRWFGSDASAQLTVSLQSFSYKRGLPHEADLVFDCRFLRNPHWEPALRPRDGRDPEVAAHVAGDARFAPFLERVMAMLDLVLPANAEEGKTTVNIAIGCTGGRHRSVMLVEKLAPALVDQGWQVSKRHRELTRIAAQPSV